METPVKRVIAIYREPPIDMYAISDQEYSERSPLEIQRDALVAERKDLIHMLTSARNRMQTAGMPTAGIDKLLNL